MNSVHQWNFLLIIIINQMYTPSKKWLENDLKSVPKYYFPAAFVMKFRMLLFPEWISLISSCRLIGSAKTRRTRKIYKDSLIFQDHLFHLIVSFFFSWIIYFTVHLIWTWLLFKDFTCIRSNIFSRSSLTLFYFSM